jgi:hypothetical protein
MISTVDFHRETFSGHSRRAKYRTAAIMWALALLIGSLQPTRPPHFHFSMAHHVAHFLCFGALAFLAAVGFGSTSCSPLWPSVASFLFGFTIEFLQHLENRKPIEWHDVRDDAIGITVFMAFWQIIYGLAARERKDPLLSARISSWSNESDRVPSAPTIR